MPSTVPLTTEAPFWGMNQRISERLLDSHWAKDCLNVTINEGDIRTRPGIKLAGFQIDLSLDNPKMVGLGEFRSPSGSNTRYHLFAVASNNTGDFKTSLWYASLDGTTGGQVGALLHLGYVENRILFQSVRDYTFFITESINPLSVKVAYFSAPGDDNGSVCRATTLAVA